ncbi:MAG: hypothetical protein M1829_005830 [Trizodia sp. TS-e1964]|nr:MAG: hypothetical protein M1829_005830 [Trizodia sp. TS-e1964]
MSKPEIITPGAPESELASWLSNKYKPDSEDYAIPWRLSYDTWQEQREREMDNNRQFPTFLHLLRGYDSLSYRHCLVFSDVQGTAEHKKQMRERLYATQLESLDLKESRLMDILEGLDDGDDAHKRQLRDKLIVLLKEEIDADRIFRADVTDIETAVNYLAFRNYVLPSNLIRHIISLSTADQKTVLSYLYGEIVFKEPRPAMLVIGYIDDEQSPELAGSSAGYIVGYDFITSQPQSDPIAFIGSPSALRTRIASKTDLPHPSESQAYTMALATHVMAGDWMAINSTAIERDCKREFKDDSWIELVKVLEDHRFEMPSIPFHAVEKRPGEVSALSWARWSAESLHVG